MFIFSIEISIKEPGLIFSSFLNDRILVIIEIILSTSLSSYPYLIYPKAN